MAAPLLPYWVNSGQISPALAWSRPRLPNPHPDGLFPRSGLRLRPTPDSRECQSRGESLLRPLSEPSLQSPDPGGSLTSTPCQRLSRDQNPPEPAARGCPPASLPPSP